MCELQLAASVPSVDTSASLSLDPQDSLLVVAKDCIAQPHCSNYVNFEDHLFVSSSQFVSLVVLTARAVVRSHTYGPARYREHIWPSSFDGQGPRHL
jgi:hypothetical protein